MRRDIASPDVVSTARIPAPVTEIPPPPPSVDDTVARHRRGHQVHWVRPDTPVVHDAARCQHCGAAKPSRVVVHQYQGWTFGQAVALFLSAFAIALALIALVMFGAMLAGPGPSTVPQPIAPRTATQ